jgi:general secretion pathway protein D
MGIACPKRYYGFESLSRRVANLRIESTTGRGRASSFVRAVLAVSILFFVSAAAQAQSELQSQVPPTVLTNVAPSDTGKGELQIALAFEPHAPTFSIIGNDSDKPSIGFALTTRGLGAKFPSEFHGLLRSMAIEQVDTVMILHFVASTTVHLSAVPTGDKGITLTFNKTTTAPDAGSQIAASGPLPSQVDRKDGFAIVPLKYADVSEVVGILSDGQTVKANDFFTPHEPAFGSAGMGGTNTVAPPPQTTQSPDDPMAQSVTDAISIDRRLNAIILKGPPDLIARLKEKIAQIDVPVQSVLLETMFVELDETGARNVGLNLNNASSQIGTATFQTGAFVPAGLTELHGLSSLNFQAAIYAQVEKGRGRIVSKPRIAAQSGSTAKIITGDALPILTSISLAGVNGVSQQVQYVNVGVTLQIAPRVTDDGFVTSHVYCVVSSVTGYQQGYPTISQREAQTSATVHDGETFVIGGLTQDNKSVTSSKVPILGDIPLLSALFDLHQDTSSKTDLYIVVTPHIIRRGEPLPEPVLRGFHDE